MSPVFDLVLSQSQPLANFLGHPGSDHLMAVKSHPSGSLQPHRFGFAHIMQKGRQPHDRIRTGTAAQRFQTVIPDIINMVPALFDAPHRQQLGQNTNSSKPAFKSSCIPSAWILGSQNFYQLIPDPFPADF
jgi:hypothetical protein